MSEGGVSQISTGIPNLDALIGGGLPANTLNIVAGEPGTGKTILAQQAMFHHVKVHPDARVLYLTTLSEPAMKVIRYLQAFTFYDPAAFGSRVVYRDVGGFLREAPTQELLEEIMRLVEEVQPEILCIDSFKAIRDLMPAQEDFRRFCYDLSVRLASAACTTLLIGEYDDVEAAEGAEFAVADGIIQMRRGELNGQPQRMIQVKKMRGQAMSMAAFPFGISRDGIRVFTPELSLERMGTEKEEPGRLPTGVPGLDELLLGGVSRGRSVMVSGVSGSGKTTLGLQFLIEGAKRGERGIFYSFEETEDRLVTLARSFGWDLERYIREGLIRTVSTPVTEIQVDEDLEDMIEEVSRLKPARIVLDSFSAFLAKISEPTVQRDKAWHLVNMVQRAGAVAILISDVPAHESNRVSRFGVEETVVDGTIVLSTDLRAGKRIRYIEVYKMRTTDHVRGRHRMDIGADGLRVFYKSPHGITGAEPPPPITFSPVETVIDGEIPYGHSWLVRGGPGSGKSVWAIQYAVERLRSGEAVLFVATEASSKTILGAMERLGLLTEPYVESGQLAVKSVEENHELDLDDPESFINIIATWLDAMPKPCTRVVDSLTPLMIGMSPEEFKSILTKGRSLSAAPDVSMLDTVMSSSDVLQSYLTNHFDVVIDLYTPDWGDLKGADDRGRPVMRLVKARGARVDTRPYPFRISKDGGVVVQKDFYGLRG